MGYVGAASGRFYKQKATYWSGSADDGYGNSIWAAPVIVDCRWEDMTEEKLTSHGTVGETVLSSAVVFTQQALKEGAYVYLGETTVANPVEVRGAFVIRRISTIPSLRVDQFENASWL
jgi:hypothetical protein